MTLSMLLMFMMMKGAMHPKFSKIANFQLSEAGLTKKGVEFHQKIIGAIRTILTPSYALV